MVVIGLDAYMTFIEFFSFLLLLLLLPSYSLGSSEVPDLFPPSILHHISPSFVFEGLFLFILHDMIAMNALRKGADANEYVVFVVIFLI